MSDQKKNLNEDELRRKIREELERKHRERTSSKKKEPVQKASPMAQPQTESYFMENYIRRVLQEEVYGSHPEFVKCENHLAQIKWLTPLEMENEFEFFPVEESGWQRWRKKWFGKKAAPDIPQTPEIRAMMDRLREEFEQDARQRIALYKEHLQKAREAVHDDLERKIFEEEQDRFYSKLKGYHKYKNHIGETAWLTREEFESQDEFIDPVYSPREKFIRAVLHGGAVVLFVGLLYLGWQAVRTENPKGYIRVDTGGVKASLYIDQQLAIGFSPGVPYVVDEGEHQIRLIASGYEVLPDSHWVEINAEDTVDISFTLQPVSGDQGYVHVLAQLKEADIYVDGEFHGILADNPWLQLPAGDHTVTLKQENYLPSPTFHTFSLNAGDTVEVRFAMRPSRGSSGKRISASSFGLIDVSSNVPGARIFLNGRPTGFQTDYVLQKIPFGRHVVRVELENYKAYPKEQVVVLDKDSRRATAEFTLSATLRPVVLDVEPANAPLFVDGKPLGKGRFAGKLPLGTHTISFGEVPGYYTPEPQTITVTDGLENEFSFQYGIRLNVALSPAGSRDDNGPLRVLPGYIVKGIEFTRDTNNGPDVV
ncbi:MAG: PEGA domain-containing protein, partial [Calditrichaeota bacterium]